MEFLVDLLQTLSCDMGVDLCGRDARVAQQLLDHPKIGPVLQQVRGKAVAQHVRRDILPDA